MAVSILKQRRWPEPCPIDDARTPTIAHVLARTPLYGSDADDAAHAAAVHAAVHNTRATAGSLVGPLLQPRASHTRHVQFAPEPDKPPRLECIRTATPVTLLYADGRVYGAPFFSQCETAEMRSEGWTYIDTFATFYRQCTGYSRASIIERANRALGVPRPSALLNPQQEQRPAYRAEWAIVVAPAAAVYAGAADAYDGI